jgi:hypothetical protein
MSSSEPPPTEPAAEQIVVRALPAAGNGDDQFTAAEFATPDGHHRPGQAKNAMQRTPAPLWVRWYPKDALDGMAMLAPREELAYRRVLDLIVTHNDRLTDDDRALAWMTKTGRDWRRVKARLLELGKITIEDGFVRNHRATKECVQSQIFIAQRTNAGRASAAKAKPLKNKNSAATVVGAAVGTTAGTADATDVATNQESGINSQDSVPPSVPDGGDHLPVPVRSADLFQEDTRLVSNRAKVRRAKPDLPRSVLEEAAALWNEMAATHGLPQVSDLTDRRAKRLHAVLTRQFGGDLGRWRGYLTAIGRSAFLTGGGKRGWRADFDWALRDENIIAVRERKYDDAEAG